MKGDGRRAKPTGLGGEELAACERPLAVADFGAVAAVGGGPAAREALKANAGLGQPLVGRMLVLDLRDMSLRTCRVGRGTNCPACQGPPARRQAVGRGSRYSPAKGACP